MADREGITGTLKYEPGRDAAERYPDWVIRHRPLSHGIPEVLSRDRKVILIESKDDWPSKRCSLAHAVAHLDLGHAAASNKRFDRKQEAEAGDLAARRLITVDALAAVIAWTRFASEAAAELEVDLLTLNLRQVNLSPDEREELSRKIRWSCESA